MHDRLPSIQDDRISSTETSLSWLFFCHSILFWLIYKKIYIYKYRKKENTLTRKQSFVEKNKKVYVVLKFMVRPVALGKK